MAMVTATAMAIKIVLMTITMVFGGDDDDYHGGDDDDDGDDGW